MSARAFTLRGGHVLAGLLLFFAAIIAVNVAFAVVAVRSFPGEDVRRSYLQGLNYNDVLADRRAQAALGWRIDAALTPSPTGARLLVRLHDRSGAPIESARLEGALRWAPGEDGDRALEFIALGEGGYAADLSNLASGRWTLRARAEDASHNTLDFESELTWP